VRLRQLRIESGDWDVGLTYIPTEDSSILMQLQQSDPTFNKTVDLMRPGYNFEPQYRVTMLPREDWTKATGAPPAVKGLIWFTDGSTIRDGTGDGVYGKLVGRRLSFSLG